MNIPRIRGFEKISLEQWAADTQKGFPMVVDYDDITLPFRATGGSAGYDIFTPMPFVLNPNDEILVPLGWKVYLPLNELLLIIPRSGSGFKYFLRLANTVGLIDSDFYNNPENEGHVWAKIRNEGKEKYSVSAGEAVAQAIFMTNNLVDGDRYGEGRERVGGLGSTSNPKNVDSTGMPENIRRFASPHLPVEPNWNDK